MKKYIVLFALYVILPSCRHAPESKPFDEFKNQIPHLKLPYKIACYDTAERVKLNIPDSIFKKYAPAGGTGIIGMIADSDFYSAILYIVSGDRQYPVLQSYDAYGGKLNDIGLINGNCCGSQPDCRGFSWGEITPDLHIVSEDSERIFIMGKDGNPLKLGSRLVDTTEVYTLTNQGYIRLNTNPSVTAKYKVKRMEYTGNNSIVKTTEPVKTPLADSTNNNDTEKYSDTTIVIYKVQIVSSPDILPPTDSRFNTLKDVEMYKDKNMYHYTVGHFITKDEALVMQIKLRGTGFKEAFVVAFKGKKRM